MGPLSPFKTGPIFGSKFHAPVSETSLWSVSCFVCNHGRVLTCKVQSKKDQSDRVSQGPSLRFERKISTVRRAQANVILRGSGLQDAHTARVQTDKHTKTEGQEDRQTDGQRRS